MIMSMIEKHASSSVSLKYALYGETYAPNASYASDLWHGAFWESLPWDKHNEPQGASHNTSKKTGFEK